MSPSWMPLLVLVLAASACTARPPAGSPPLPPVATAAPVMAVLPGGYRMIPDTSMSGYTEARIGGVTLVECAKACSLEERFHCASFDYYPRQRICEMSEYTAEQVGLQRSDRYGATVTHYERLLTR